MVFYRAITNRDDMILAEIDSKMNRTEHSKIDLRKNTAMIFDKNANAI